MYGSFYLKVSFNMVCNLHCSVLWFMHIIAINRLDDGRCVKDSARVKMKMSFRCRNDSLSAHDAVPFGKTRGDETSGEGDRLILFFIFSIHSVI